MIIVQSNLTGREAKAHTLVPLSKCQTRRKQARKTRTSPHQYQVCCKSGARRDCISWIRIQVLICLEPDGGSVFFPIKVMIVLDRIFSVSLPQISPSVTSLIFFSSCFYSTSKTAFPVSVRVSFFYAFGLGQLGLYLIYD